MIIDLAKLIKKNTYGLDFLLLFLYIQASMYIKIISLGKSSPKFIEDGIFFFLNKLQHFDKIEWIEIPMKKSSSSNNPIIIKKEDSQLILNKINEKDHVILLDDKGKKFSSEKFAQYLEHKKNTNIKHLVFVIGGAYGFSDELYALAKDKISFSEMTFSHQMIRLIFLEQLYRGYTIVNGIPYHHA